MYTRKQIKAIRANNINRLASLGDGDVDKAKRIYNRLVRFSLRWNRWATDQCNGHIKGYALEIHKHEGELLFDLRKRLDDELAAYDLKLSFNGLYPTIDDQHRVEIYWY